MSKARREDLPLPTGPHIAIRSDLFAVKDTLVRLLVGFSSMSV